MVLNHSNYYCNNRDSDPSFFFPRAGMLHVKPLKANTFLFAFKQHLRSVLSHIVACISETAIAVIPRALW